ncbi:GAF and ANTAR domain-containing protein [Actinophytocola glycyrrhizae]|uniref:GAF and ANTAR domain-containing protein n=1 Tax=Actinophytocola glycyrrhizae TaxID=2044873 RepID=A0ABV9S505_9PSEU
MPDDILSVASELVEMTRLVADDDFGATMARFVTRIVRTVPGCDDAIITVRSAAGVETVHSSRDLGFDPLVPGPIVEAVTFGEPRRLDDVANDQRWPSFGTQFVNAGYRSLLCLPVSTAGENSAVLTLLSTEPDRFGEAAYDPVLLLTLHAGVTFDNASLFHDSQELVIQLRAALRTRSLVGQAQGMLMRHFGYDSDRAFELLKRTSQNNNRKLRDLAATLVDAHEDGTFEDALIELGLADRGADDVSPASQAR